MAEDNIPDQALNDRLLAVVPGGLDFRFRQNAAASGMLNRSARKVLQMRLAALAEHEEHEE